MQYSQEHLKTMVYAEFGGQTECIMGNWKIENITFVFQKRTNVSFLLTDAFIYPFYPGVYQKSEELCSQVFSW